MAFSGGRVKRITLLCFPPRFLEAVRRTAATSSFSLGRLVSAYPMFKFADRTKRAPDGGLNSASISSVRISNNSVIRFPAQP
jgi:hypothetical protein